MESVRHLIIGAGVTGLAAAAFLRDRDYLVLEADREVGGYCKTIRRDGFVWDYSGHFFHFKHPEIEGWLRQRMVGQNVRVVQKRSFISYGGRLIDFPFPSHAPRPIARRPRRASAQAGRRSRRVTSKRCCTRVSVAASRKSS